MKKFLSAILIYSLMVNLAFAGKLQNADFKSEAELIAAGATKAQLLNDDKIYVTANGVNDKLSTAIANGVIGGAGSESGINLINSAIASFESGSGWTATGGTFSYQTYTNGSNGDTKYGRFISTTSGQYVETALMTVPTNFSGGCQIDFKKFNTSTASAFKIQALNSSNAVLAEQTLNTGSWIKAPSASFACPTAGTTLKFRLISLLAGTIEFDKAYLGSNQNLVNTSQTRILGGLQWAATANCLWSVTSASYATFGADLDCDDNPRTAYGATTSAIAAGNNEGAFPQIKFGNMPAGDYEIVALGDFRDSGTAGSSQFRFSDGTITTQGQAIYGATDQRSPNIIGRFSYAVDQTNITWQMYGLSGAETASINGGGGFEIYVKFYPKNSDIAISPDQASWLIDANIGGANVLTNNNASSYIEISNSAFDMVINSSKGSANAEIPCSGTNPSTGLTCAAGAESLGVSFIPPYAGQFEACFDFGVGTGSGTIAGANATFQLIETPNNAQTILQEGGDRKFIAQWVNANASYAPAKVCGTFTFNDVAKKTIRLMNESSSANSLEIKADRGSITGQNDIKVTVRPVLSQFNRPVLTGSEVTRPGAVNPVDYDFLVDSAGGVANLFNGNLVSSCTSGSPHVCTFNAGKFASGTSVVCYVNITTAGPYLGQATAISVNGVSINSINSSTLANTNSISSKSVRCTGIKP